MADTLTPVTDNSAPCGRHADSHGRHFGTMWQIQRHHVTTHQLLWSTPWHYVANTPTPMADTSAPNGRRDDAMWLKC